MKKIILILLTITISLFNCKTYSRTEEKYIQLTTNQKINTINIFPKAKKNEIQHIINLPVLDNEQEHKVEIFIAKTIEVDCNNHFLAGKIEVKELSGWGYDYYLFKTDGNVISTMMACPDKNLTKKDVFSESKLINYNSKIPIIIYTPKGYKVKYRLWNTLSKYKTANPIISTKKHQLTLRFDSHKKLNIQTGKAIITIFGFDASLADVPASVIYKKEIDISSIPFSVIIDVPQNPESLIKTELTSSSNVKYYLSFESHQEDNKSILLDNNEIDTYFNLADLAGKTFYLKFY